MLNIEKGKPVHCIETVTGRNLTGALLISADEIRADLYSYANYFQVNVDQPVFLTTETGQIASLHASIDMGTGTTSRHNRRTYHQVIISNVAVVGHDQWTNTDAVKKVSFIVEHSMVLLRHKDKVKALGSTRHPNKDDFTIFKDAASGMTFGAWYGATYSMEFDAPKKLWPTFDIEFDEPKSIRDYIKHVSNYVAFISFCLGVKLKPDNIRISRLSHDEMMAAIEAGTYVDSHEVHYVWPDEKIETRDSWAGGAPIHAGDEEELAALRACLLTWMNRADVWEKPYNMMMTSFALKNVISAERLITACRWFEDIPIAQSQNALSDEDIIAIAAVATLKAEELRHPSIIRNRIEGAIKRIRAESAEERFSRLVAKIEEQFGKGILPENVIMHLKRAI